MPRNLKSRAPIGARFAAETLEWRGTPFVWNQAQKGRGCDCRGLIVGALRELGRPEAESFYATFCGYRVDRAVPSGLLLEGMASVFERVAQMLLGDVLLLKHDGSAAHMAVFVDDLAEGPGPRAVHALPGQGSTVRDRQLGVLFHRYPLHSVWRLREGA